MKKILISILLVLLAFFTYYVLANGISIGSFEALGISAIKDENKKIDDQIEQATKLTNTDYPQKISELNKSTKDLLSSKQEYTDRTTYSTQGDISNANQSETYTVEFLWERIGSYATKQGLVPILNPVVAQDSSKSTDGRNLYDINFTVTGKYIQTALFLSNLENDSFLEFKIENFKMIPSTDGNLQSTFVVKNIPIDIKNLTKANENIGQNANNTGNTTDTGTQSPVGNTMGNTVQ